MSSDGTLYLSPPVPLLKTEAQAGSYTSSMPSGSDEQACCMPFLTEREAEYDLSSDLQQYQTKTEPDGQAPLPATTTLSSAVPNVRASRFPTRPLHHYTNCFLEPTKPTCLKDWPTPYSEIEQEEQRVILPSRLQYPAHHNLQQRRYQSYDDFDSFHNISGPPNSPQAWSIASSPTAVNYQVVEELCMQQRFPSVSSAPALTSFDTADSYFSDADTSSSPVTGHLEPGYYNPELSSIGINYDSQSYSASPGPVPGLSPGFSSPASSVASPTNQHYTIGSVPIGFMEVTTLTPELGVSPPQEMVVAEQQPGQSDTSMVGVLVPFRTDSQRPSIPYAKLIERALLTAPKYTMSLQDIYQWFCDNTDKPSFTKSGWKNSIRHNLSMNAVSCLFRILP